MVKDVLDKIEMEKAVWACLQAIPFITVQSVNETPGSYLYQPDMQIIINIGGNQTKCIVCDFKNNGQPRIVRMAISQLLLYAQSIPQSYPVFVAPYISLQSAKICREQGVGYIDLAGNCCLSFDNVYISKESKDNPFAEKRELRSLYSPKAERVLRVLLNNPSRDWKTQELADEADISLGQVAKVKNVLVNREWIYPPQMKLINPETVLEEWSSNYDFRRNKIREFYSFDDIPTIEEKLAEGCRGLGIQYALSGFSAAIRRAPMVRYQKAMAYVNGNIDALIDGAGVKEVTSGANLTLLTPYDEGVFYNSKTYKGIYLVSDVQNYLDLRKIRGRGEEAAATLLEEVIRAKW